MKNIDKTITTIYKHTISLLNHLKFRLIYYIPTMPGIVCMAHAPNILKSNNIALFFTNKSRI